MEKPKPYERYGHAMVRAEARTSRRFAAMQESFTVLPRDMRRVTLYLQAAELMRRIYKAANPHPYR